MASSDVVVYYSRTGNTHRVARAVTACLDDPAVERVHPSTERAYPNWLCRSAIPGSRVDIEPVETDLSEYGAVFLGTPKWTLSCPPITEYVERADFAGATVGLFVTYGGFDQRRYIRHLAERIRSEGGDVVATLLVRRDALDSREFGERVERFCRTVTAAGRE